MLTAFSPLGLSSITNLDLERNAIPRLPYDVDRLQDLIELHGCGNPITGLPFAFANLRAIKVPDRALHRP